MIDAKQAKKISDAGKVKYKLYAKKWLYREFKKELRIAMRQGRSEVVLKKPIYMDVVSDFKNELSEKGYDVDTVSHIYNIAVSWEFS